MPLLFDSDTLQPLRLISVPTQCWVYHISIDAEWSRGTQDTEAQTQTFTMDTHTHRVTHNLLGCGAKARRGASLKEKGGEEVFPLKPNRAEAAGNLEEATTQEGSWDAAEVADQSTGRHIWSRWPSAQLKSPEKLRGEATGARTDVSDRSPGSCFSCTGNAARKSLREAQLDGVCECVCVCICMCERVPMWAKGELKTSQSIRAHYGKQKAHGGDTHMSPLCQQWHFSMGEKNSNNKQDLCDTHSNSGQGNACGDFCSLVNTITHQETG